MRIIVVEDDMQLRERHARALRARGHDVAVAADRPAARAEAARSFDAAVVDLRLGQESGLDVGQRPSCRKGDRPRAARDEPRHVRDRGRDE